jgi:hypothetical protein
VVWELGEDLRVKLAVGALPTSSGFLRLFFKTDPCATGSYRAVAARSRKNAFTRSCI